MGLAACALHAYRAEERGPIQGALNFAIANSVGAYLSLTGIALIYGRTGALNLAQIGAARLVGKIDWSCTSSWRAPCSEGHEPTLDDAPGDVQNVLRG